MQNVTAAQCSSFPRAARARRLGLLALCLGVLASGCASPLPRPPADLDLRQTEIVADLSLPALSVDGYASKGSAAGAGAAKGFGSGAVAGTLACLGAGPFFPLCAAAVAPLAGAIGAVGWATASAVNSEGEDAVASKRDLLASDVPIATYPSRLAAHLRETAQDRLSIELPVTESAPTAASAGVPRPWRIELALTEVACEDNKPGQPFSLRVEGRVRLRHSGQDQVAYEKSLTSRSASLLTTAQWRSDGASAARASLEQSLRWLAEDMLDDLMNQAPGTGRSAAPPL